MNLYKGRGNYTNRAKDPGQGYGHGSDYDGNNHGHVLGHNCGCCHNKYGPYNYRSNV